MLDYSFSVPTLGLRVNITSQANTLLATNLPREAFFDPSVKILSNDKCIHIVIVNMLAPLRFLYAYLAFTDSFVASCIQDTIAAGVWDLQHVWCQTIGRDPDKGVPSMHRAGVRSN